MVHADDAMSTPRTMNALQDCLNYIEGLCMMYIRLVVLVCGCTKAADLRHNVESTHHECAARLHQMHRGALHDEYRARSACLRWDHASWTRARAQYGESEPVVGCANAADLRHNVESTHHECAARLPQLHRGALHDVYRARSACLRWDHASWTRARAQYGESEPVWIGFQMIPKSNPGLVQDAWVNLA